MFSIVVFRFWLLFGMTMPLIFFLPLDQTQVLSLSAVDSSLVRLSFKQLEPATNPIKPTVAGVIVSHQFVMAQSHTTLLESQLNKLDTSAAQANVGIGVLDLNTGESWFQNGLQKFPIALRIQASPWHRRLKASRRGQTVAWQISYHFPPGVRAWIQPDSERDQRQQRPVYLQSQEGPLYNNERQEINKRQRRSVYLWSEVFRGG